MMTPSEAAALRNLGFDPKRLPPGTRINGRSIEDFAAVLPKPPKGPNKTEARWIAHLEWLRSSGLVTWFRYEPFRLRLTDPDPQTRRSIFYVPDFLIVMAPGSDYGDHRPRVVETKGGFVREDAMKAFRSAADLYRPAFRFSMLQLKKGGRWESIMGETWLE